MAIFPVTQITLPSEGKCYPEDSYLWISGGKLLLYPLLTRHEDMIASAPKNRTVIISVMKELIAEKEVCHAIDSLAYYDLIAILLASKIIAYGPELAYNAACPTCEHVFGATINILSDLKNKEFTTANFYIETVGGDILLFKCPTVKDIYYHADSLPPTKLIYTLLCEAVINGIKTDKSNISTQYIDNLTTKDVKEFRSAYKAAAFGFDTTYSVICPKCGEKHTYAINLPDDIFTTTYADLHTEIFDLCTKSEGGFNFFDVYELPVKYRRNYIERLVKEAKAEEAKRHKDLG